jgi:hypothetical protein
MFGSAHIKRFFFKQTLKFICVIEFGLHRYNVAFNRNSMEYKFSKKVLAKGSVLLKMEELRLK